MKKSISKIVFTTLILSFAFSAQAEDQTPFIYKGDNKRDPMWPLVNAGGIITTYNTEYLISDLSLEGIIAGADGSSIAMINGSIVRENDKVGQFVVTIIQPNAVILKDDNDIFELKLKKEE